MHGLGWGLPPDSPGHAECLADETRTFGDALEVMAAMLGVTLEKKRCTAELAYAPRDPSLHNRMTILPAGDLSGMSARDFHAVGMTITALPAVNAIPAVCRAEPGIRTYADLPVVAGRGRVVPD